MFEMEDLLLLFSCGGVEAAPKAERAATEYYYAYAVCKL
jgi:hypothetical protein